MVPLTADMQKGHLRGIFPYTDIEDNHGSDLPYCPSIFVQTGLSENSQNGNFQQGKCSI